MRIISCVVCQRHFIRSGWRNHLRSKNHFYKDEGEYQDMLAARGVRQFYFHRVLSMLQKPNQFFSGDLGNVERTT